MPAIGELLEAASLGEVEGVGTLIAARANLNERDEVSDGSRTRVAVFFLSVVCRVPRDGKLRTKCLPTLE